MRCRLNFQRIICLFLAAVQIVFVLIPIFPLAFAETEHLTGDINQDGVVDASDLTLLSQHVVKIALITDKETYERADLNEDGTLTAADITVLYSLLTDNGNAPLITDVSVNQIAGEAGNVFEWSVQNQGGNGTVEYAFQLTECGINTRSVAVIAQQAFSTSNNFNVRIMDPGTYSVTVTCKDEDGQTHTLSDQARVTVEAANLKIHGVNFCYEENVYVGQELRWFVQTSGGIPPYNYTYTLLQGGIPIVTTDRTEAIFDYKTETSGVYTLEVSCADSEGNAVYAQSSQIIVEPEPAAPTGVPAPVVENPEYTLADTVASAMYVPLDELHFSWKKIDHAVAYEVTIEVYTADTWTEVLCDTVSNPAYAIAPEMLAGWTSNTLFRLRVVAQGITAGEESISYFYTHIGQTVVTVDNSSKIEWNVATAEGTVRSFAVSAPFDWTVTTDSDWITLTPDEQGFTAQLTQNTGAERSGTITVSDGTTSAYVLVKHGVGNGAPQLYYPAYSSNPDHPTEIPVGGMILGFDPMDANYVSIRIFEKSVSGQLCEVYQGFSPKKEEYHQVVSTYHFRANTDYVIEMAGCVDSELEHDTPKNYYYVRMVDKGHQILLEGTPEYAVDSFTDFSVKLYSTGAWTYTTDASWLRPEDYDDVSYKKDYQTVSILLQPNETYESRKGTITFHCGDTSATLTVIQKSCLPHFLIPENVSQDENNPTILPSRGLVEKSIYQSGSYATFKNGVWSEETSWGSSSDINEWTTLYPDDFFLTDVLYRFTMHIGEHTAVYYVKFSDTVRKPYAITRYGVEDFVDLQLSFPTSKSEDSVDLSTSGAWSIVSDSSWLSVSATSGTKAVSRKEITITAEENHTGQDRTGILTFFSEGQVCANITVTQSSQDHVMVFLKDEDSDYILYDPLTSFKHLDGSRNYVYFKVESPLSYTVTSSDSWITCKKTSLILDANTTGKRRTGIVVISCGTAAETITVTQEAQLALPTLVSPALSTTQASPSVMENSDVDLVFNAVEGAVRYVVYVSPADRNLLLPGTNFYSFYTTIQADGASTYSCRIPRSALSVDAEDSDDLTILAYDSFGYSVYEDFFVKTTSTGAAMINGTTAPVWDNATDIAVSEAFVVRSTGAWKAVSRASWISLDKTSGNDGDTLTLTLQANTGAARSGQVLITVGSNETILTVNQCAFLQEYPSIASPVFSGDSAIPTILSKGTTSLHVNWNYEPQAEYYKVFLLSFKSNSVQRIEASSPKLNCGEYTFENLILEPGQRYSLKITRMSHWGYTSKSYFFTLSDANAYVSADDLTELTVEMDGTEDFYSPTITSSGVWSASVSDSWILVDNERITQADMDLEGYVPEDFSRYSGVSGDDLYISVLQNTTDSFRYGTVTLRCGSAESTISIIQEPNYVTADIYAPQLANTRQSSTSLPYGSVTLRWSGASGGTGRYRLAIYERDEKKEYRYHQIKEIENITNTYYTIPQSMLTEGQYYKIWLGTEINGTDDYPGRWYYFRAGYQNELLARVVTNWNTVGTDGFVTVNASASGGAGGYRFSYELLRNGQQVGITELDDWDYYTFNIRDVGNYQVRVYVRDAAEQGANALSGTYCVGAAEVAPLRLSEKNWNIPVSGGNMTVTVEAYDTWKVFSKPDWIECSIENGTNGAEITLTAKPNSGGERSGYVTFSGSGKSASIFVRQDGNLLSEPTVAYPAENAALDLVDIPVSWNAVSGAGYYIFRLRDLTTDDLLIHEINLTGTVFTVPAGYLQDGHAYRIAVGAAHNGEDASSGSIAWAEREFSIAASSDLATTISGFVTDKLGNPLEGAVVHVFEIDSNGNGMHLEALTTDADGIWEITGLKRGGTYGFTVSISGYTFDSDAITVNATESKHSGFVFCAANHHQPAALYPENMDFGSEAASELLHIDLTGKWTAQTDASWITLSVASGSGAAELEVSVSENAEEEPREGTVLVTDQEGNSHTLTVYQEEAVKVIHVAYKANTAIDAYTYFDQDGKYTGVAFTAGSRPSIMERDTYIIDKDMEIPAGTTVRLKGNVVIKANVTFANDTSVLTCTGNLTVAFKGVIDLSNGGEICVNGNFIFKPREKHDTELSDGTIKVGGDIDLRENFYSNTNNELHLFCVDASEKTRHTVDVDSDLFDEDQVINKLYLDSQGYEGLNLKHAFRCNYLDFANTDILKQTVSPDSSSGQWPFSLSSQHTCISFREVPDEFVCVTPVYLGHLDKTTQMQILSNLHIGLVDLMQQESSFWGLNFTEEHKQYSYLDQHDKLRHYSVYVESADAGNLKVGTIRYYEEGIGVLVFLITQKPETIFQAVDEWYQVVKKEQTDKATAAYKSIYKGILVDMIWGALAEVPNLGSCFETAAEAEAMLGELAEHNSELQDIYALIDGLN